MKHANQPLHQSFFWALCLILCVPQIGLSADGPASSDESFWSAIGDLEQEVIQLRQQKQQAFESDREKPKIEQGLTTQESSFEDPTPAAIVLPSESPVEVVVQDSEPPYQYYEKEPQEEECLTCPLSFSSLPQESPSAPSDRKEALKSKMQERMTIDFKDSSMDKVFRLFSEWTGSNIVLDPQLQNNKVNIYLKDATLQEALDFMMNAYELKQAQMGDLIFVSSAEKINAMDSVTRVVKLRNIKVQDAEKLVVDQLKSISSDTQSNTLVMTGTPSQIDKAISIMESVDKPQRQVLLTAQVLEVSSDSGESTGVTWGSYTGILLQEQDRPIIDPSEAETLSGWGSPFKIYRLARSALDFQAIITHLLTTNKAKMLANPRITAVAGKEAKIFIGQKVPYEMTTVTGGSPVTEVRFVEAGVRLTLTPGVIENDYVVVNVAPEVSYISAWKGTGGRYPEVSTREAEAMMRLNDGETFILGGLLSEEETVFVSKVPFFSNLPLLGNLFKSNTKETKQKEIIITVTAQIISQ